MIYNRLKFEETYFNPRFLGSGKIFETLGFVSLNQHITKSKSKLIKVGTLDIDT